MRTLAAVAAALAVGCGPGEGTVSLVLDIPNAMLDPKGFSSVEVRLHHADGDTEINVAVIDGKFDLGEVDIKTGVMIEAALRTDSGAAVGYGRAAAPADFRNGERIVIPVRRPIIYFAGLFVVEDANPNTNDQRWSRKPPTFSDLSSGTFLDGSTVLPENAVMTIAAGPALFVVDQMPMDPSGMLVGMPTIKSVSTGDHTIAAPLTSAMLSGAVVDAAGSDDGRLLLIGTTTQLFVVDTESGTARPVADGNFSRVAIVTAVDGTLSAVAIRNRSSSGACTAELVWLAVNDDDTNQVMTLATGGFTDVAGDGGRAFYVNSCNMGELGEATAAGAQVLRSALGKPPAGSAMAASAPTALAVSNGQAWIGLERPATASAPAGMALISAALVGSDPARTLFDEPATQVVEATDYPGVQRELDASSVVFMQLEVGAGGDYVATTLAATYEGEAIVDANFPAMEIESQELRVIDTSTAASVQRYRSWCAGVVSVVVGFDIENWNCATSSGQQAPASNMYAHRISSMTFQYGKK